MPLKKISLLLIALLHFVLIIYQSYPDKPFSQYLNYVTINWILISTIYFLLRYSSPNAILVPFISGFLIDIVNQEYLGLYTFLFFVLYLIITWIKQYLFSFTLPIFMLLIFALSFMFNVVKLTSILLVFNFNEFVYYLKEKFFIEIILNTLASIFVYFIIAMFKGNSQIASNMKNKDTQS